MTSDSDEVYFSDKSDRSITRLSPERGYDTHRCPRSLRAECSIRRYPKEDTVRFTRRDGEWHLYKRRYDFDYDTTFMEEVARIDYCPFCGEPIGWA